jgi:transposase
LVNTKQPLTVLESLPVHTNQVQSEKIASCLLLQRGNARVSNLQVLNAIFHTAKQGCRWRGLTGHLGTWHALYALYALADLGSKSGVLDHVFTQLQQAQIVLIKRETISLDGTSVKVHPDGTDALKKRCTSHW